MTVAKLSPGTVEAPYVASGEPQQLKTGISNANRIENCTTDYVILINAPTTCFNDATDRSGYYAKKSNQELNLTTTAEIVANSTPIPSLYGGSYLAFSNHGLIWAQSIEV